MNDHHDPDERVARALREWAARPATTDASTAARRIIRALPEPKRPGWVWRPVAAVVATALLALTVWLAVDRGPAPRHEQQAHATLVPVDDNVVVWWLDDRTQVVFLLDKPKPTERNTP